MNVFTRCQSKVSRKKGSVSGLMKNMKDLPNEEKPAYGQKVNELRQAIQNELEENKNY